jgi:hypothetical protein
MLRQFFSWQVFIPQQQADQPTALKALLFFLVSFLGPREITAVLIHVPAFYAWTRANHDLYLAIFFTLQLFVTAAFAAWLGRKYRVALFEPRPLTNWKTYIAVALIAAPFFDLRRSQDSQALHCDHHRRHLETRGCHRNDAGHLDRGCGQLHYLARCIRLISDVHHARSGRNHIHRLFPQQTLPTRSLESSNDYLRSPVCTCPSPINHDLRR